MCALILASSSPQRRRLLQQLGLAFEVRPADVDETPKPHEPSTALAERLAVAKAQAVARRYPQARVLGSDTVVVAQDGRIFGKPADLAEARHMWDCLGGTTHEV